VNRSALVAWPSWPIAPVPATEPAEHVAAADRWPTLPPADHSVDPLDDDRAEEADGTRLLAEQLGVR
jgi:hypothetical protein